MQVNEEVYVVIKLYGGLIDDVKLLRDIHNARSEFIRFVRSRSYVDYREAKENGDMTISDNYMHFIDSNDRHNPEIYVKKIAIL